MGILNTLIALATLATLIAADQRNLIGKNTQCIEQLSPSQAVSKFSWNLFQKVEQKNPNQNIIVNPLTVQYLLTVLKIAASGLTEAELCKVLMVNNQQDFSSILQRAYEVSLKSGNRNEYTTASGVFIDRKVRAKADFLNYIKQSDPNVVIREEDFSGNGKYQSISAINDWASHSTRGEIKEILNPSNDYSFTQMLLTNAAYFKGTWKTAFKPSNYEDGFKITSQQRVLVPFMYQRRQFYAGGVEDSETKRFIGSFVELPYESNTFTMFLILPNENVNLQSMVEKIDLSRVLETVEHIPTRDVNVTMPKFYIKFSKSLLDPLTSMGLTNTFSAQASFPKLLENENAAISDLVQEAFINVDEKGTKAAAVTTVSVLPLSASPEPEETLQFTVDRPFLAVITLQDENRKRIPLFISKVINPQQQETSTSH